MAEKTKYRIIVSDKVKQLLGAHIRSLALTDESDAKEKQKLLVSSLRALAQMPQRFLFFNEPYIQPNKYHKMIIENRYLLLFQIKDDAAYVNYVLDCQGGYDWLLRSTTHD